MDDIVKEPAGFCMAVEESTRLDRLGAFIAVETWRTPLAVM